MKFTKFKGDFKCDTMYRTGNTQVDWLQSLKHFFINVSYHILVASHTPVALFKTEPTELDRLQVYDTTRHIDEKLF